VLAGTASGDGHLEVERKFKLSASEPDVLPARLQARGFKPSGVAEMTDFFLPSNDKGEMLRVRRESLDGARPRYLLTLKHWLSTAGGGKERQEAERQVKPILALIWLLVGRFVNGGALLSFSKTRSLFDGVLATPDGEVTAVVSIDEVSGLKAHSGHYLEVEVLMPTSADVASVKDSIFGLAAGILADDRPDVKMSYRDMLVESIASS
jgi:adenylate cyclase class IV